jgi:catechol 2,3-dioxygenase-like lactoylglutathione lyase family enzyme
MLRDSPIYAYFPAKDLDRARRFYEQTLGLVPKSLNNGGVTYEFAGGTAAFLYLTDNAGTSKASQAFWSVADVDREIVELRSGESSSSVTTTSPASAARKGP